MSLRGWVGLLRAGSALGLLVIATAQANAGAFAIREQSAAGQGSSFAGVAAGGALSSMFWNPATMTQYYGKAFEADVSMIVPRASQSYTTSGLATVIPTYAHDVDNSGNIAGVPSSYSSWQLTPQLWLGLSVNSPFGLSVAFPTFWAGGLYAQNSDVKSYNFSPALAYKINDMISIAAGLQVQYMTVNYSTLASVGTGGIAILGGSGYSYGFTVGATITPMPGTVIGIGYRSALNQKINGSLSIPPGVAGTPGSVSTTLNLPDMVTVGLRQRIGDRFTLLAGFEWSNWSRIGTSTVTTPNGSTALIGTSQVLLPFQYSDGYMYSLGGEYMLRNDLTLRAGIAFEKSPITDGVRTPRLPDNDRMWYSVGATYKPPTLHGITFDLGYSYIDVKDTPVTLGPGTGNPWSNASAVVGPYVGSVDTHINIFSLAVRYQWDADQMSRGKMAAR